MGWGTMALAASGAVCAVRTCVGGPGRDAGAENARGRRSDVPLRQAGEGEPVLFVHGAVGDYRKWDGLWEDVAAAIASWPTPSAGSGPASGRATSPIRGTCTATISWRSCRRSASRCTWWGCRTAAAGALGGDQGARPGAEPGGLRGQRCPTCSSAATRARKRSAPSSAGFGDVAAALEAEDYDEAARELIEAIYALPEGGFDSIDPVQQAMVLDNAHTMPLLFGQPDAGAAGLRRARRRSRCRRW